MSVNLTCTQVGALLSFYIDNKLSEELKQFVEAHLKFCPKCRLKLETLRTMLNNLREAQEHLSDIQPEKLEKEDTQYSEFKTNLSAYIDNELSNDENIKIKKHIISNPKTRQEIENMYRLKKALHNAFEKTRNECKDDYVKLIFRQMDLKEEVFAPDSFKKVVALVITIFTVFTFAILMVFWV